MVILHLCLKVFNGPNFPQGKPRLLQAFIMCFLLSSLVPILYYFLSLTLVFTTKPYSALQAFIPVDPLSRLFFFPLFVVLTPLNHLFFDSLYSFVSILLNSLDFPHASGTNFVSFKGSLSSKIKHVVDLSWNNQ